MIQRCLKYAYPEFMTTHFKLLTLTSGCPSGSRTQGSQEWPSQCGGDLTGPGQAPSGPPPPLHSPPDAGWFADTEPLLCNSRVFCVSLKLREHGSRKCGLPPWGGTRERGQGRWSPLASGTRKAGWAVPSTRQPSRRRSDRAGMQDLELLREGKRLSQPESEPESVLCSEAENRQMVAGGRRPGAGCKRRGD